jgi:hypothetical protein
MKWGRKISQDAIRTVAHYRVSTDKQGRSGLGLEAQKTAVQSWLSISR